MAALEFKDDQERRLNLQPVFLHIFFYAQILLHRKQISWSSLQLGLQVCSGESFHQRMRSTFLHFWSSCLLEIWPQGAESYLNPLQLLMSEQVPQSPNLFSFVSWEQPMFFPLFSSSWIIFIKTEDAEDPSGILWNRTPSGMLHYSEVSIVLIWLVTIKLYSPNCSKTPCFLLIAKI